MIHANPSAPLDLQNADDRAAHAGRMSRDHLNGCAHSFGEVRALLRADLFRYAGRTGLVPALHHFFFTPGFKYTVWLRWTGYLKRKSLTRYSLYPLFKLMLLRCRYKYGIAIPENTVIGPGFFINRFGGIYIHNNAILGSNVNVTAGTLLGEVNRGSRAGAPIIGDRVFLGSGAKVIGRVWVGDDAAIGANALVTEDVPQGAVMASPRAVQISSKGSAAYINRQAVLD